MTGDPTYHDISKTEKARKILKETITKYFEDFDVEYKYLVLENSTDDFGYGGSAHIKKDDERIGTVLYYYVIDGDKNSTDWFTTTRCLNNEYTDLFMKAKRDLVTKV